MIVKIQTNKWRGKFSCDIKATTKDKSEKKIKLNDLPPQKHILMKKKAALVLFPTYFHSAKSILTNSFIPNLNTKSIYVAHMS